MLSLTHVPSEGGSGSDQPLPSDSPSVDASLAQETDSRSSTPTLDEPVYSNSNDDEMGDRGTPTLDEHVDNAGMESPKTFDAHVVLHDVIKSASSKHNDEHPANVDDQAGSGLIASEVQSLKNEALQQKTSVSEEQSSRSSLDELAVGSGDGTKTSVASSSDRQSVTDEDGSSDLTSTNEQKMPVDIDQTNTAVSTEMAQAGVDYGQPGGDGEGDTNQQVPSNGVAETLSTQSNSITNQQSLTEPDAKQETDVSESIADNSAKDTETSSSLSITEQVPATSDAGQKSESLTQESGVVLSDATLSQASETSLDNAGIKESLPETVSAPTTVSNEPDLSTIASCADSLIETPDTQTLERLAEADVTKGSPASDEVTKTTESDDTHAIMDSPASDSIAHVDDLPCDDLQSPESALAAFDSNSTELTGEKSEMGLEKVADINDNRAVAGLSTVNTSCADRPLNASLVDHSESTASVAGDIADDQVKEADIADQSSVQDIKSSSIGNLDKG